MTEEQCSRNNARRIEKIDAEIKRSSLKIAQSFIQLQFNKKVNREKMVKLFIGGVIGLAQASCTKRDLVLRLAKEEIATFVDEEFERVKKRNESERLK